MNWISVKDSLPENEDMVLIFPEPDFDESGRKVLGYYAKYDGGTNGVKKNNWYCLDTQGNDVQLECVTHWIPLPNRPPRLEGKGE